MPAGWVQTTPNPADLPVISGQNGTVAFGNFRTVMVSGVVYNDLNSNGVRDANEPGLSGFTVQLFSGTTLVATAPSVAGGAYSFTSIGPGTFQIILKPRRGFVVTAPVNGYTVTTMSGNDITGRDIGVSRRSITVTSDDSGGPPPISP